MAAGGRWAVIQHVDHEGPGTIARVLTSHGAELSVVRPAAGDPLPDPADLAGLVVMGGPMSVHDTGDHPWLAGEVDLLRDALQRAIPVLGVCLGAQLLAVALGADVSRMDRAEIGEGTVELTPAGRRDRVFGPEYRGLASTPVPCVHWHGEAFSLPAGAVHLAATRHCPVQAFRFGDRAYGLQFHIEVDADLAAAWAPHLPEGIVLGARHLVAVEDAGTRLIERFVRVVARMPVGAAR